MKSKFNIYELLNNYLNIGDEDINLLEGPIDSELQLEYFELSKNGSRSLSDEDIIRKKDQIFDDNISQEQKKLLLVQLASVNNIDVFRTIEKYLNNPDRNMACWAYMALMENRLLIESDLLEENKVLISTGLGGKGNKLRYFIVFFTSDGSPLSNLQQNIIRSELNYAVCRHDAEIENVFFEDRFACSLIVLPVKISLHTFFNGIITECNEFGDFLFKDYIISNIKILSIEEMRELLSNNNI